MIWGLVAIVYDSTVPVEVKVMGPGLVTVAKAQSTVLDSPVSG